MRGQLWEESETIKAVNKTVQQLLIPDYTTSGDLYRLGSVPTLYHLAEGHFTYSKIPSGLCDIEQPNIVNAVFAHIFTAL